MTGKFKRSKKRDKKGRFIKSDKISGHSAKEEIKEMPNEKDPDSSGPTEPLFSEPKGKDTRYLSYGYAWPDARKKPWWKFW